MSTVQMGDPLDPDLALLQSLTIIILFYKINTIHFILTQGGIIIRINGDKFLSIPCEKSSNVLHITHPLIMPL